MRQPAGTPSLIFLSLALSLILALVIVGADIRQFDAIVDSFVDSFNAGDMTRIRQDFSQSMAEAVSVEKMQAFQEVFSLQFGKIVDVGEPVFQSESTAEYPLTHERGMTTLIVTLDAAGRIDGLLVTPRPNQVEAPSRNVTPMRLPFEGAWYVFWGGATKEQNYHVETPNQRYACDFVIVDAIGRSYSGDGKTNDQYYCFGRRVLAPADGVVTEVIRGVRDNQPGSMNPYSALGNAVIIKHSESEFSVLAHFKQGTLTVNRGDKVTRGQLLGLCGNSGNSSEAHLHFHLQNSEIIQDAQGIPCLFDTVVVHGIGSDEVHIDYAPVKGQRVSAE